MPTLTITKNYDDGTTLTESQLDDIKSSIETFVNTTKLNSDNIQTGGIATANYAAASVDAAAIASSAVTTAKINDSAVTTAKINDSAVTTAKINDAAVTQAKRAALGQQTSSSCSAFTTTSSSYTDVTNLSVSITTTGRPVYIGLIADTNGSVASSIKVGASVEANYKVLRDATNVGEIDVQASGNTQGLAIPPSSLSVIDVPSAGTYTYKIQAKRVAGSNAVEVNYAKLIAYEL